MNFVKHFLVNSLDFVVDFTVDTLGTLLFCNFLWNVDMDVVNLLLSTFIKVVKLCD